MSRPVVIAVLAAVLAFVGFTVAWFVLVPQPRSAQTPSASEEQRQRAEDFFDGDPDRSVRDGQEMKPRW